MCLIAVLLVCLLPVLTVSCSRTCDHVYGAWSVTREPTCVQMGARRHICSLCGAAGTEPLKATDHNYVWVTDTEPTEEQDGESHEECLYCGVVRKEHTVVPKLAHEHVLRHQVEVLPTCVADGRRAYSSCETCNAVFTAVGDTWENVVFDELRIPALGHSFTNYVSNGDATVAADGTKTAVCSRAGCTATSTIEDIGSRYPDPFPD